tara:strand:+ start:179 stop:460 length:282 start_codon:yes stop_codon:yes gene_type:complete
MGVSIKANPNKTHGNPVNKKDLKNSANEKKIISLRREIFLFLKSFLKLAKKKELPQKNERITDNNSNAKGAKITVKLGSIKNGSTIHTKEQIK